MQRCGHNADCMASGASATRDGSGSPIPSANVANDPSTVTRTLARLEGTKKPPEVGGLLAGLPDEGGGKPRMQKRGGIVAFAVFLFEGMNGSASMEVIVGKLFPRRK